MQAKRRESGQSREREEIIDVADPDGVGDPIASARAKGNEEGIPVRQSKGASDRGGRASDRERAQHEQGAERRLSIPLAGHHCEPAQLRWPHETRTAEIRCPLVDRCQSSLGAPWKFPQGGAEDRVGPCVRMASARKASETPDEIWQKNGCRHDYRDTGYQRAVAYRCGPRLTVRLS